MKHLNAFIFSLATFAFSVVAHAAPVQYQITATHTTETTDSTSGAPAPTDSYLFADGTQISATFFYDSATSATSSNNVSTSSLIDLGANSYYTNSITNFVGTVSGSIFSSPFGDTIVADGSSPSFLPYDGVFNTAGEYDTGFPPAGDIVGFSVGDFSLVGYNAFIVGAPSMLSDQSLPTNLSSLNGLNTGIHLFFKNSAGESRVVKFWSGNITPVPLPSSALFFLSGLVGLGANAARKLKR